MYEFNMYTADDLNEFLRFITSSGVYQHTQMEKKVQICKRLERSHLNLELSEIFKLTDITDETFLDMFMCTGSRLQMVGSDHDNFIVVRSHRDNFLQMGMVNDESLDDVDEMLIDCAEVGPCDVIMCSIYDHEELCALEIAWLNYRKSGDIERLEL